MQRSIVLAGALVAALGFALRPSMLPGKAELPGCRAAAAYSRAQHGVTFVVVKNGEIVCEDYAPFHGPWKAEQIASGVKGLSALLVAAATQDGLLTLDEPVAKTIIEWRDDTAKRRVTIGQLLALSGGLAPFRPDASIDTIIGADLVAPPGRQMIYTNEAFDLFGELLRRKLERSGGESVKAYFRRRIGGPARVRVHFVHRSDGAGVQLGAGARMKARDWARLGDLIRRDGIVDGRALVDARALRRALDWRGANPAYGGGWWRAGRPNNNPPLSDLWSAPAAIPDDALVAVGRGKQRLYLSRDAGLVIVRQAMGEPRTADEALTGFSDLQFWRAFAGTD